MRDLLDGDFDRKDIDNYLELVKLGFEAQEVVTDVVKFQAQLAAAIVLADLITWVDKGGLNSLINSKIVQGLEPVWGSLEKVKGTIEKEEERIRGVLNQAGIAESIDTIRKVHNAAAIISPEYRGVVEQWNNGVRDLSREVFGDVSTLNSGLAILQMSVYDVTAARGEPVDIANRRYFELANDVTANVQRRSKQYARDPGKFWFDLNNNWIDGLFYERSRNANRASIALGEVTDLVNKADSRIGEVDKRFSEYRDHLDAFLSDEQLIELDSIRRNFNRDVKKPLGEFSKFMTEEFPKVETEIDTLESVVDRIDEEMEETQVIIGDPEGQDDQERLIKRNRFSSIFDAILEDNNAPTMTLAEALRQQESLYNELEDN